MSSLTALFGNSAEKSSSQPDDEKLMDLYWNRNELKKEFADLRDEKFRLQDRIKQQDGAIARLQQKLDHIEDLLIDPDWGRNVLVFYQLRGVGLRCQRKLERFAEQLKQQREQKQQGQIMSNWRASIVQQIEAVEAQISERQGEILELEGRLQAENRRLSTMNGFVRLFRGRAVSNAIDDITLQIQAHEQDLDSLRFQIEGINQQPPPDAAGLDLTTKRSINFMILSFAQQLYLLFDDDDLVTLIKEAGDKSAGAIRYGSDSDCESIFERLNRGVDAMEKGSDFAEALQKRAKLIGERAVFQSDDDAVPAPGTVATLYRFSANGTVKEGDANILGENYWGIAGVLSR